MGAVTEITSTVAPASNLDSRAFWMALSVSGYLVARTAFNVLEENLMVTVETLLGANMEDWTKGVVTSLGQAASSPVAGTAQFATAAEAGDFDAHGAANIGIENIDWSTD